MDHIGRPLHAGQTVFAAIRRNGPAADILVTGLNAEGGRQPIPLDCVSVPEPLPRLLWSKARINALLARGEDASAIALAKQANIICRGAAFIAWDEAETVAVARDEVYQPSVELAAAGLSCSTMRKCSFFERRVTEYGRSFLRECSDDDLVGELDDGREIRTLIEQLQKQIGRAFGKKEAGLLGDILEEWAKQSRSGDMLRGLLRDCGLAGTAEGLRHTFSAFLQGPPSPWGDRPLSILMSTAT